MRNRPPSKPAPRRYFCQIVKLEPGKKTSLLRLKCKKGDFIRVGLRGHVVAPKTGAMVKNGSLKIVSVKGTSAAAECKLKQLGGAKKVLVWSY